jgi:hypothetical protein
LAAPTTHAHAHTHTRARAHTHTHTHTRAHTHTHTHTHTRTHARQVHEEQEDGMTFMLVSSSGQRSGQYLKPYLMKTELDFSLPSAFGDERLRALHVQSLEASVPCSHTHTHTHTHAHTHTLTHTHTCTPTHTHTHTRTHVHKQTIPIARLPLPIVLHHHILLLLSLLHAAHTVALTSLLRLHSHPVDGVQGHDCAELKRTNILELFDSLRDPGICMVPVGTDGDGDCLLHAASIGMWGVSCSRKALSVSNSCVHANSACSALPNTQLHDHDTTTASLCPVVITTLADPLGAEHPSHWPEAVAG